MGKTVLFPPPNRSLAPPRVVITGMGIVTALGNGWKANAEGFRHGRTAFRPVTAFDVSRQRVRHAAEVDLPDTLPITGISEREQRRLGRAARLLLLAAYEAWESAGWNSEGTIPMVLGTTSGGMALGEHYFQQATAHPRARKQQPTRVVQYQAQNQALQLQNAFGLSGPITIIANACASGANAIGHAWSLLRTGQAERVLTGGYDAISQLVFSGFDSLQALSPTQCRPFDAKRDGLALGEGAAVITLETLEAATKRRAPIVAELCGYGAATDGHHLTQPHPQGDAAFAAMQSACAKAGVPPHEVGYVNAHGTGTPLNDSAEALAINRWSAGSTVRVSSTKSSIGHLLGAAGAVEAVVCAMALKEQWLPPTTTIETVDPHCEFEVVRKATDHKFDYAVSNSFGFGGANASLLLRRWS